MKQPDFSEFPTLTTPRLVLRSLSPQDLPAIYQLRSDPIVAGFTGRKPISHIDEAAAYLTKIERMIKNNECVLWAIAYQNSQELIGAICLWNFDVTNATVEIGYELLPAYHKQGIMAETIARVLDFGFNIMGVKTILAFPSAENLASVKLLEKAGFKLASDSYQHTHTEVPGILTYTINKIQDPIH
ncbi:GNAT family N-acetyltransferase [Pedobacter gandavensis]|uniref:GNAT family N-acetyltransferase n=1 Tax=Pedobacter gandavensis TaxID=2679963 RepID=UPI002930E43C|nr:GNAT family N-acetyltransferase [Pedobacter gandavensis]